MLRPQIALARIVGRMSRASRRGGGTSLPGKVLLRTSPHALERLGAGLERGSVVVSATNGKTTTTGMIASVLREAGISHAHNRTGANMPGGIATALLERTRRGRLEDVQLGLFEVDEAWVTQVVEKLHPHTLVLGNLFRDQLDRYGELERLADDWAELAAREQRPRVMVLNADDPLVADLGRGASGDRRSGVVYFGVEDRSHALPDLEHAFDAKHCRRCGSPYRYSAAYLGHLGDYFCPACGNVRPQPTVAATRIELSGMSGSSVTVVTPEGKLDLDLRLPGLYNVYNALAATACCLSLGLALDQIRAGLESWGAARGPAAPGGGGARAGSILLIKNPVGANEVFRTLAAETARRNGDGDLDLLMALNDRIADGRDVSWIWDADFELLAQHAGSVVCSGTRASELALRLKYAGVPAERIEVRPELDQGLDRAAERDGGRPLYVLPTYTAMLELQELLTSRGHARPYWE
jgi:lipid II isoglutaminyl synthase (glutamine-hydrolysing)